MTDKIKAAEILKGRGYDASVINGVVTVHYEREKYEQASKDVRGIIKEIGYDASWGLIAAKSKAPAEAPSVPELRSDEDGQMSFI